MSTGARIVAASAAAATRLAARWLAARAAQTAFARGACSIALAGGETPRPAYAQLAALPLADSVPWARVDLWFGDERAVPPSAAASNFRMVCEAFAPLLGDDAKARPRLHRLDAERPDPGAAAADYDAAAPLQFDIVVLGIGADGHTASLFPGSPALGETRRGYVAVEVPALPPGRVTLTPPRLAAAGDLLVLATGAAKAEAVADALCGPWHPSHCPAQLARRGTWILDAAAAARLADAAPERMDP